MKFYVDTSVLVAYYCPELLSEKVEEWLMAHSQPCVSMLTEVEFFSAVSRKVREGGMNRKDATRVMARWIDHIDRNFYQVLFLEQEHYRLARDWIALFEPGLKTLDALHLAIASSEGLTILTADGSLSKSAKSLGLHALLLE